MILARIDGSVVAAHAHPSLRGWRIAICQPISDRGEDEGEPVLAIDPLHAGRRQRVMYTTDGESTRERVGDPDSPLRNMIVALIDT